ncbi:hypothetical protein [Aquimarina pacifica]|uniref:hypothetical protein n=1 Tax=Aquimarina pacifica TaxID=1296415 RepID=UPI0004700538|nr:hypothetical protein [Aquimarina pacifica]
MKDIEQEVIHVLSNDRQHVDFESPQPEEFSPLNQAVIEKGDAADDPANWNPWKPESIHEQAGESTATIEDETTTQTPKFKEVPPLDAPEQDVGSQQHNSTESVEKEPEFELPTATAKQAADTILGMTNNVLAVGGGYFIKIGKHQEFFKYEEIIELIDQQNQKNVDRLKLDKEDKAMLKPLIVAILKQKAKKLTPEQQLTGAIMSIAMKKIQVVMEVRAENQLLTERMRDIIREEEQQTDKKEDAVATILHDDGDLEFTKSQDSYVASAPEDNDSLLTDEYDPIDLPETMNP